MAPERDDDRIDPTSLHRHLGTRRLGRAHEHHDALASTNDRALAWADRGAPWGALVTADHQTAGRGRRGRAFLSPAGTGIYASLVLRSGPPERSETLALAVGLGIAEGLSKLGVDGVGLKWPNDIFLAGGKAGGVLCEAGWRKGAATVVAGFGINVHAAPPLPEDAGYRAACVAEAAGGAAPGRAVVLAACLDALENVLEIHRTGGFSALRDRYLARSVTVGRLVRLEAKNDPVFALDVAEDGALVVRGPDGRRSKVTWGDVSPA